VKQSPNIFQSRRSTATAYLMTCSLMSPRSSSWRTQLEIARQLGIDKSTLVPLLDRLERDGLVVRTFSERDRRVRIPQATPAGAEVVRRVAIARDAAINDRLAAIPPSQRAIFHATLWSIVEGGSAQS
jgi:DNA-binding MarR family transcriptional regulator